MFNCAAPLQLKRFKSSEAVVKLATVVVNKLKDVVAHMDAADRQQFVDHFKRNPSKPASPPKTETNDSTTSDPSELVLKEVQNAPSISANTTGVSPKSGQSMPTAGKTSPPLEAADTAVDDGGEMPMDLDTSTEASPADSQSGKSLRTESSSTVAALRVMDDEELLRTARNEEKMEVSSDVLVPKPLHKTVTPWFLRPAHEVEADRKRLAEEAEKAKREAEAAALREQEEAELADTNGVNEPGAEFETTPTNDNGTAECDSSDELDFALAAATAAKQSARDAKASSNSRMSSSSAGVSNPVPVSDTLPPVSSVDDPEVWDMLENFK